MKLLHHLLGSARIAFLTFLLLLLVTSGSGSLGCGQAPAAPDRSPAQALRLRFPEQAGAVLAPAEDFVSTAEGFVLGAATALPGGGRAIKITLPREGRGVVRLRAPSGFEV